MDIPIIFDDNALLVIDKPAGVVVNRSENVAEETIQDWAENKLGIKNLELRIKENNFYNRAGIVHRLDKETSGLLLIAKNPQVFTQLQVQFANRTVTKKYMALVHGQVLPAEGKICVPVGRLPWNRRKFGVISSGRVAETIYNAISYYKYENKIYTLLEACPHTGRTHQIRIHLKYLNHSIVGDELYAGRQVYQEDMTFCPRLFLHAAYLCFQHPVFLKTLEIKCELTDELQHVIGKLHKIDSPQL